MITKDTFNQVCKLAGLIQIVNAKVPTWKEPTGHEAIELVGDRGVTLWFKDGERVYDQPTESSKIVLALRGLEEQPNIESKRNNAPDQGQFIESTGEAKKHNELVIGSVSALAGSYGISKELADLFFMKFENQLYIKNPGLLYLAAKKGYGHMLVTDKFDETTKEWVAEYKIYPVLTKEILDSISKLNPAIQEIAMIAATMPTNGIGRASSTTIKMKTMLPFARELAQTRAQNRALRAYTGYGGCSAEELE